MAKARQEVVASSPYFVPGPKGMAFLKSLRDRGVKVTVLTNSLSSTDEPAVHVGYSRYREDMLKMGVDLYELSPEDRRRVLDALPRVAATLSRTASAPAGTHQEEKR